MFVLVHGAGMGASCWDRLLPHLDRPAVAVDLPGRGSRADVDLEQTDWILDRVVDDSAALLTEIVDLRGLSAEVPRTYIRLTEDHCYPPELQSAARVGGDVQYLE